MTPTTRTGHLTALLAEASAEGERIGKEASAEIEQERERRRAAQADADALAERLEASERRAASLEAQRDRLVGELAEALATIDTTRQQFAESEARVAQMTAAIGDAA